MGEIESVGAKVHNHDMQVFKFEELLFVELQ